MLVYLGTVPVFRGTRHKRKRTRTPIHLRIRKHRLTYIHIVSHKPTDTFFFFLHFRFQCVFLGKVFMRLSPKVSSLDSYIFPRHIAFYTYNRKGLKIAIYGKIIARLYNFISLNFSPSTFTFNNPSIVDRI